MDSVTLPPELERFAAEAVASGRYRDLDDVLAAGVGLLRRAEAERAAFVRSLEEAEAESDREGWLSLEDVMAEADAIIAVKRSAACAGRPASPGPQAGSSPGRSARWSTPPPPNA